MNPDSILSSCIRGKRIIPNFLGVEDTCWLSLLLAEFSRFEGRPRRTLLARMKEPYSFEAPSSKLMLASSVLKQKLWNSKPGQVSVRPRLLRTDIFKTAHILCDRETTLKTVAAKHRLTPEDLMSALFNDLSPERPLITDEIEQLTPIELALESNLRLVKMLLARSRSIVLEVFGQCRHPCLWKAPR